MSKFCSECENEVPNESIFCSKCGYKFITESTGEINEVLISKKSNNKFIFLILFIFIALVLAQPTEQPTANNNQLQTQQSEEEKQKLMAEAEEMKRQREYNNPTSNNQIASSSSDTGIFEIDEVDKVCSQLSDITQSYQLLTARYFNVSASSVQFLKAYKNWANSCTVTVDTSIGPKNCAVLRVLKIDNSFAAGVGKNQISQVCGL